MSHEYAFDAKLFAVIRVRAPNQAAAIAAIEQVIECLDLSEATLDGVNSTLASDVRITEVSLAEDGEGENRTPFEIDGADPE